MKVILADLVVQQQQHVSDKESAATTHDNVLSWAQALLARGGEQPVLPVVDLSSSWRDGIALCHLVQSRGARLDTTFVDPRTPLENIRTALQAMEDVFGTSGSYLG